MHEWQGYAQFFKELLSLDYSPVGVSLLEGRISQPSDKRVRICRALLDAGRGEVVRIDKANNACFGASWHLGFRKISDQRVLDMVKKFVVEGEKLFCSYDALENLIKEMQPPPDTSAKHFLLSPLEGAQHQPDLCVFVCNAEAACRLLTLSVFIDGKMPRIQIGGPTCRMSLIYPLLSQEVNISFYDYTARKICNVEKDKLLVTVPYQRMASLVKAVDTCSAGRAKIEFPPEFRQFLQNTLAGKEGV